MSAAATDHMLPILSLPPLHDRADHLTRGPRRPIVSPPAIAQVMPNAMVPASTSGGGHGSTDAYSSPAPVRSAAVPSLRIVNDERPCKHCCPAHRCRFQDRTQR